MHRLISIIILYCIITIKWKYDQDVNWTRMAQNRDKQQASENMAKYLRVPKNAENFWPS